MKLENIFDKYTKEEEFIRISHERLKEYGFSIDNTIAGVCLCRDEICQSVLLSIKNCWGEVFNFSSFAGVYTLGELGLKVFISHCPQTGENKKCVFYVFSHIGIDENGNIGSCKRKGLENSTACGALILLHNELSNKNIKNKEKDNIEMKYLKERVNNELSNESPNLLELTQLVCQVTCKDIETLMKSFNERERIDYAIISGIQVHYLNNNYIVPKDALVLLDKQKIKFRVL